MAYQVLQVPPGAALQLEPLGTKYKFWYVDQRFGLTLFKQGRHHTGENWAEVVACEIATHLGLPRAFYLLAEYEGRRGVVCPTLVARGARLILGNELLSALHPAYGQVEVGHYRRSDHTLRRVTGYLRAVDDILGCPYGFEHTNAIKSAQDVFVGYLMLDALIANQDRHDNNWGVVRANDGNLFLAPTFDHGSSLARNETDAKRETMLTSRDPGQRIETYVLRARSAVYPVNHPGEKIKAYLTIDAFSNAARQAIPAAREWLSRLDILTNDAIRAILEKMPDDWMSECCKTFTSRLIILNRDRLRQLDI